MSNDRSCYDCKYYHAEYGGVCFAQKDAPRVFWQIGEYCDDFTYKDARILLDPISLSKDQVRDIYEFLNGKDNPTGEGLYKNICEDISRAITEHITAAAERLVVAADRDRRLDELQEKMLKEINNTQMVISELKETIEYLDAANEFVPSCEDCTTEKQLLSLGVITRFHDKLRNKLDHHMIVAKKALDYALEEYERLCECEQEEIERKSKEEEAKRQAKIDRCAQCYWFDDENKSCKAGWKTDIDHCVDATVSKTSILRRSNHGN